MRRNALEDRRIKLPSQLQQPLADYLQAARFVDVVDIDAVFDMRALKLTWAALAKGLEISVTRQAGFPRVGSPSAAGATWFLNQLASPQVVRRS